MAIPDTFANGLRPLQLVGALDIFEKRRMLLADQPGAGKTAQALFALEMAGLFDRESIILILCNVTGCQLTWSPEIRNRVMTQHSVVFADLTNPGLDSRGRPKKTMPSVAQRDDTLAEKLMEAQDAGLPLVIVANYDLVNWKFGTTPKMLTLFGIALDAVLIDESHLVLPTTKDHPSQTTQFWSGLQALRIRDGAMRLSMSGTPDRGKLERRYGHWKFLFPEAYLDYFAWLKTEFQTTWEKVGVNRATGKDIMTLAVGKLRHPDLWAQWDHDRMIRRTKAEMLQGLPPKQWAGEGAIDIQMTPDQIKAYNDFEADLDARYEELLASPDEKDQNKASALKLQFALRARQMAVCTWTFTTTVGADGKEHTHGVPQLLGRAGSGKLGWLLDEYMAPRGFMDEEMGESDKVVIVSYFTEVLEWLQKELATEGVESEIMSGKTNAVDKKRVENRFQNGDLRVILLSGYLGVSINLDAADDMIFIDSVHDPDKMEQAEDRIHRASRDHVCTYFRLCAIESIDVPIIEVIDARFRETRKSYDGARNVEFARKMLPAQPRELELTLV